MAKHTEQITKLKAGIEALEIQRSTLGDMVVDTSIKGLYQQIAELAAGASEPEPSHVSQIEGERRHATIVFSDLSGYTAMTERLDPEEVQELMAQIKTEAIRVIEYHGGIVNQFIGDEVVALFGIPTASKEDPNRAVRAVMELHDFVRRMNEEVEEQIGQPLRMHTGINTGLIVTHLVDDRDGRYGLTGDTVNTGARLLAKAKVDEILVSPDTRALISTHFELEALRAVELKGKAESLTPYRVIAERSIPVKTARSIVGRQKEIKQFKELLKSCLETGKGQALLVRGDAGIGKTRLIREFQSIALNHSFTCHSGLVLDFGVGKNQDAIRTIFYSLLEYELGSDWASHPSPIEELLNQGLISSEQEIFIYDLLDVPQPLELKTFYEAMDNESRNRGKQQLVGTLLKQVSAHQPAMIIIEDVHWSDPLMLDYWAELTSLVTEAQVILVMTSRIEGDPLNQEWQRGLRRGSLLVMNLISLEEQDALVFASEFPGITMQMATKCIQRAEGNPLFLEQLLLSAEENKEDFVPGVLQSVILSKVDRLKTNDKLAIQAASILGQRFSLDLLGHLMGIPYETHHHLIEQQLIRPIGNDYLFTHSLVQEGIYHSLLKRKRRLFHQTAAEWFEGKDVRLRAEHLDRAEDSLAPQVYLEAAELEVSKYHYNRALPLVERGLELCEKGELQYQLMCFKGKILYGLGWIDQSITAYRNALNMSKNEINQAHALLGMAEGMRVINQSKEAFDILDQAEPLMNRNHLIHELAQLYQLRGNLYFPLGEIEGCCQQFELSYQYAQQSHSLPLEASALGGLGDGVYLKGRMRTANDYFHRCIEFCRKHGYKRTEATYLPMFSLTELFLNKSEQVIEACKTTFDIATKISHHRAKINAHGIFAMIYLELGEFEEAKKEGKKGLELSQKLNTKMFDAEFLRFLGSVAVEEGRYTEAIRLLEQALESCRNNGMNFVGPTVLGKLAETKNDLQAQHKLLEEGEALLRQGSVAHNYFFFSRSAIAVSLDQKDWDEVERYASALEDYTRLEPLPWSDFFIARGRTLAAFGRGEQNDALFKQLRDLRDQAVRIGFKPAVPALEEALSSKY